MTHPHQAEPAPTISPVVASALAGGLVVGLSAATAALAFIGPQSSYVFGWLELMLVGFLGSVFGVVAGAVAGASETGEGEPRAAPVGTDRAPTALGPAAAPSTP